MKRPVIGLWKTVQPVAHPVIQFFRSKKYQIVRAEASSKPQLLVVCGFTSKYPIQSHRELWRATHRFRKAPILVIPSDVHTRQTDFPDHLPGRVWKSPMSSQPDPLSPMIHRWLRELLRSSPWPLSWGSLLVPERPTFGTAKVRKFPTGKWKPRAWFSVQEITELPPWLIDRCLVDLTIRQNSKALKPYLTFCGSFHRPNCCERHELDQIPVRTVIDRCPLELSLILYIDHWPLEYIPTRYLRWYASGGVIKEEPRMQTDHPTLTIPLHLCPSRPLDLWPHATKVQGRQMAVVRNTEADVQTNWYTDEVRLKPYGDLLADVLKVLGPEPKNWPWYQTLTVPEHLVKYHRALAWNHTITEENDVDWRPFYGTGYWIRDSIQIEGTWQNVFVSAGRSNRNRWGSDPFSSILFQNEEDQDDQKEEGEGWVQIGDARSTTPMPWTFHGRPNEAEWSPPEVPLNQFDAIQRLNRLLEELERMESRFFRIQDLLLWKFNEKDRIQYHHDRAEALDRLRSIQEEVECVIEPFVDHWASEFMEHFWDQLKVTARQVQHEPDPVDCPEPVDLSSRLTNFLESDCQTPIDSLTWLAGLLSQKYTKPRSPETEKKVSRSVKKTLQSVERQARSYEEVQTQRCLRRLLQPQSEGQVA